jgi:1-acyl-sn-glycerol-3-phosphate acyltransferase
MLETIRRLLSFTYDDQPMDDSVYESHRTWVRWLHDYYLRVQHSGFVDVAMRSARRERVLLISNHSLTVEAILINYKILQQAGGHVGTLVFREAFKLPFVREFFRSFQCMPVSVQVGAQTLKKKHVLLFPEGMDFIRSFADPEGMAPFHTGFLRIARQYMKETRRKSLTILPVAHDGIEKMLKFWVIKNEKILNTFIRPIVKYPFWVIPKLPLFFPSKVVVNWGRPVKLRFDSLGTDRQIHHQAERFRLKVLDLRRKAHAERERLTWGASLSLKKIAEI